MLAGVPYILWPIGSCFILLSSKKEEPFLYYHAVQALLAGVVMSTAVFVSLLGLAICFRVMPGSSTYLPGALGMGALFVGIAIILSIFLTALFLGWRATEGEMIRLPLLGDFAESKMLDQTGMTRRQYERSVSESSLNSTFEEEIPFPEETARPMSKPLNKLEATRQARGQDPVVSSPPPRSYAPPKPQPLPSGPVVKEVDLIGHYKDPALESAQRSAKKNDVLRQWLSSVDEDA